MQIAKFVQTSEYVSEAVLCFFRLAKMIADTASPELVANGNTTKEMKKDGMLVASEKLSTASIRGFAKILTITVPMIKKNTAFKVVRFLLLAVASATSSPSSVLNSLCSCFTCYS